MAATTKIAIVGFTGKMARLITTSLLNSHPNVEIHGISRSLAGIDKATSSNPRIKLFEAGATDSKALRHGLTGTSTCICCYLGDNTLMTEGQRTLIDACIAEKVPRYIASDWSFDFRGLKFGDHPSKDPMKHIQAYLEEKAAEIKGVHVLTGAFMEVMWAPHGFVNVAKGTFRYSGTGDEKLEMTTMEDSAKYTAEVAVDESINGFVNFLGDSKSIKEMAKIYQDVYGVEPQLQPMGSLEDLYNTMTSVFQKAPGNVYAWMGMYYQYYMLNGKTLLGELSNDHYPQIVPTTIETFLKSHTKESVGSLYR